MKFACGRCGKVYASADDPRPGTAYAITCRACGCRIVVRAGEAAAPLSTASFSVAVPLPPEAPSTAPPPAVAPAPPADPPPAAAAVEPAPSAAPAPPADALPAAFALEPPAAVATPPPAVASPAAAAVEPAPSVAPPPVEAPRAAFALEPPAAATPPPAHAPPAAAAPPVGVAPPPVPVPQPALGPPAELARARPPPATEPVERPANAPREALSAEQVDALLERYLREVPEAPRTTRASARSRATTPRFDAATRRSALALAAGVAVLAAGGGYLYWRLRAAESPEDVVVRPQRAAPRRPASAVGGTTAPRPPSTPPEPGTFGRAATRIASRTSTQAAPAPSGPASRERAVDAATPDGTAPEPPKAETAVARAAPAVTVGATSPPPAEPRRALPAAPPAAVAGAPAASTAPSGSAQAPAAVAAPAGRLEGMDGPRLTRAEVAAVVASRRRAFDDCVADWRRREPQADVTAVRVDLFITIEPTGEVASPALDNPDIDGSALGACLKAASQKMVFRRFAGDPVDVRIPLVLGEMAQ